MDYRYLFLVLVQAFLKSILSSGISSCFGKELTASHCIKTPSWWFKSGCDSFIWWAQVLVLIETAVMILYMSVVHTHTHTHTFSLCQSEKSEPTQLFVSVIQTGIKRQRFRQTLGTCISALKHHRAQPGSRCLLLTGGSFTAFLCS